MKKPSFFELYPDAKQPCWKVGEQIFLNHQRAAADKEARKKNLQVIPFTKEDAEKPAAAKEPSKKQ